MKFRVCVNINLLCHCKYMEVEANSLEEACENAEAISDTWEKHPEIYYEATYAEEL
jgi:hypothetical protein